MLLDGKLYTPGPSMRTRFGSIPREAHRSEATAARSTGVGTIQVAPEWRYTTRILDRI
jgi:hypothetical protein